MMTKTIKSNFFCALVLACTSIAHGAITPGELIDWDAATEDGSTTPSIWEPETGPAAPADSLNIEQNGNATAFPTLQTAGVDFSTSRPGITKAYDLDGSTQSFETFNASGVSDNNNDNYQNLPNDPTDDDATIELWVKLDDTMSDQVLWEAGGTTDGAGLYLDGDTQTIFLQILDNGDQVVTTPGVDVSGLTSDFIHIVSGIDLTNDLGFLYVNGSLTNPGGTPADDTTMVGLADGDIADWAGTDGAGGEGLGDDAGSGFGGAPSGGPFGFLDGKIAIFRIYDSLLTGTQVQDNFDAVAVPEPNSFAIALIALVGVCTAACRTRLLG